MPEGGGNLAGTRSSARALRLQARALSYDESLVDPVIESHLGGAPEAARGGRKKRPLDPGKNKEKEASIATSVGFPKDSLSEEEIEFGVAQIVGEAEQDNYVEIRNHILARWRESASTWLDEARVMENIRIQHKVLVGAAYRFLCSHGYINFGVARAIKALASEDDGKCAVIVIGAGLAGLAAARQLLAFGHRVAVVEGRNRPGGRVYTRKMEGGGRAVAADLGGSVITGLHGNPLGVLARQLSAPLHKVREKCPLYQPDGSPLAPHMDAEIEAQFNDLLDRASSLREKMGSIAESISLGQTLETLREEACIAEAAAERQLLDWHLANLEYANAGLLSELSLAYWDQDDPYEMGGDHCFLAGGNIRLVSALAEGIPIFYGKQVHTIRYGSSAGGVQVITPGQVFEGDAVLCTVPLGVLKQKTIAFEPELPPRKLDAIRRLGFGLLNKVAMLFPRAFWGPDVDTFGHLAESSDRRGEFFLFYSYAAVSGGPLLLALIAGEAAIKFELMHPAEAIQRVMTILRGNVGNLHSVKSFAFVRCIGPGKCDYTSFCDVCFHLSQP
jgi:lysine-specific histone demethylase 1